VFAVFIVPFLVTLGLSLFLVAVGHHRPTWMKWSLLATVGAVVLGVVASLAPGTTPAVYSTAYSRSAEVLSYFVGLGVALMPTLAWLTVGRNRPLRWRLCRLDGGVHGILLPDRVMPLKSEPPDSLRPGFRSGIDVLLSVHLDAEQPRINYAQLERAKRIAIDDHDAIWDIMDPAKPTGLTVVQ
jgi:hypothetical protein